MKRDNIAAIPERVALVYDSLALEGGKADLDVLSQLDAIEASLLRLGCGEIRRLGICMNLGFFMVELREFQPNLVFNLVESIGLSDRLQTIIPLLLEDLRIPFTGSGSAAMLMSNHKVASKRTLAARGLPFPPCLWLDEHGRTRTLPERLDSDLFPGQWIIKAVESHASLHLDDNAVAEFASPNDLAAHVADVSKVRGQPFFAERYIEGREFNVSLLDDGGGQGRVLPLSEIRFIGFAPEKPRIVGFAAKWNEESDEYRNTPRSFDLGQGGEALAETLGALSAEAWEAFGLAGYARVDFRLDALNRPYILEVNTNPCLSPDAGLAAAAAKGGLDYDALTRWIAQTGLGAVPPATRPGAMG